MEEQFKKKCSDIFEKQNIIEYSKETMNEIQVLFDYSIPAEYMYILENYADIYLREEYSFKPLIRTPLTNKDGFNRFSYFFSLHGRNSFFRIYEIYRQQLPEELLPIAEVDGGNLLCINKKTGYIYLWIHDEIDENIFLVNYDIVKFIFSIEEHISDIGDLGLLKAEFSDDFLKTLKNYKRIH